jgi:hypothetical protein
METQRNKSIFAAIPPAEYDSAHWRKCSDFIAVIHGRQSLDRTAQNLLSHLLFSHTLNADKPVMSLCSQQTVS